MKARPISLALSVLILTTPFAFAQQRTTATFDDWTVSCATPAEPDSKKSCEMIQIETLKDQQNPVAQVSLSRNKKDGPFKLVLQVPPTVWIETGVKFIFDDKDPGIVAVLKWCTNTRCLAEVDLPEATVARLRARKDPGQLAFKEAGQRDVSIPVSFKGFAPAFENMQKQQGLS